MVKRAKLATSGVRKAPKPQKRANPNAGVTRLRRELAEALERQKATSEILAVINSSKSELQPVLDTIVRTASRLCDAEFSLIYKLQDGKYHLAATNNTATEFIKYASEHPLSPGRGSLVGRTALEQKTIHLPDCLADPEYVALDYQRAGKYRSTLGVPLQLDAAPVGVIALMRAKVKPFTDRQIELVTTFANQAVIAIQNARLFDEVKARTEDLQESLEFQTAISSVLNVISRSPSDIQPVLDTIAETAQHLCKSEHVYIMRLHDDKYQLAAAKDARLERIKFLRENPVAPDRGSVVGRVALERRPVHILDVRADSDYTLSMAGDRSYRTMLGVPLLRDGVAIGVIILTRGVVQPFDERQIDLVSTFADQALIAIENVRLFDEVQARTDDLAESLQQQTATSDVLKVISRSTFDLQTVLDTLTESAARLCGADMATITRQGEAGHFYHVTNYNFPPDWVEYTKTVPLKPARGTVVGRALLERKAVQIADVLADPEYTHGKQQQKAGFRTFLGVPLLREGQPIGVLSLCRRTVDPFTEKQIALVSSFADQAVIAIENVRLFDEVQARTDDLQESLQQQTATSDVLKVISRSTFDLQTVLDTLVESVTRLCEADHAWLFQRDGDYLHWAASFGHGTEVHEQIRSFFLGRDVPIDRGSVTGRSALEGRVVHVPDVLADAEYTWNEAQKIGGYRSALGAPLLRDGKVVGVIFVAKTVMQPFTDKQIELVSTFADQAVIAIENVRLFDEVQARTDDLAESLQQQTATADVLKVISRSTFDLQPVLKTLVESAVRLCDADKASSFSATAISTGWLPIMDFPASSRNTPGSIRCCPDEVRPPGAPLSKDAPFTSRMFWPIRNTPAPAIRRGASIAPISASPC